MSQICVFVSPNVSWNKIEEILVKKEYLKFVDKILIGADSNELESVTKWKTKIPIISIPELVSSPSIEVNLWNLKLKYPLVSFLFNRRWIWKESNLSSLMTHIGEKSLVTIIVTSYPEILIQKMPPNYIVEQII